MRRPAFWDTSALVPLCLRQDATSQARALRSEFHVAVWWGTSVEIASAIAKLLRFGHITMGESAAATQFAARLERSWTVIQPSESIRIAAAQLVGTYDLSAADSLQLAAALAWCEDVPRRRVFLTADRKLHNAALLSGFASKLL